MNRLEITPSSIAQWARLGPRATYGQVLLALAEQNPDILALSADLGNSSGLDRMKKSFPNQFINTGIAEQNMIGVAAGLAKEGFTVFASSFAPFQQTQSALLQWSPQALGAESDADCPSSSCHSASYRPL